MDLPDLDLVLGVRVYEVDGHIVVVQLGRVDRVHKGEKGVDRPGVFGDIDSRSFVVERDSTSWSRKAEHVVEDGRGEAADATYDLGLGSIRSADYSIAD